MESVRYNGLCFVQYTVLGTTETDARVLGAVVLERARLRCVSLCRASLVKLVSRADIIRTTVIALCVSGTLKSWNGHCSWLSDTLLT
jgi:hypothetical protein